MNPFDGILPDFALFGTEFTQLWQKLLAGAWGIALVVAAFFLIMSFVNLAQAGKNPEKKADAQAGIMISGIAVGLLVAVPVVWGAIAAIAGA